MKAKLYFTDKQVPIAIASIDKQQKTSLHSHEFYELVVVLNGTGIHFTEDEEYKICSGDIFLISPYHVHGYRDTQELKVINILYLPERMNLPQLDISEIPGYRAIFEFEPKMRKQHNFKSHLNINSLELRNVELLIESIAKELDTRLPGKNYLCCAYFMQLQCLIARCYSKVKSVEGMMVIGISDLINYMEKNYHKQLSLEKLAKVAKMSKSTLNRNFTQTTGVSPVKYLINIRIAKAAELLLNSSKRITEIAFIVGFNDSNYFIRQFHKTMGVSPNRYRKSNSSLR